MQTHHAQLVVSPSLPEVVAQIREQYVESEWYHAEFSRLGIDDVRHITRLAHQTSDRVAGRVFVLGIQLMTVEAQNALLKLFEEPPINTWFVVVMADSEQLLPTLRSRLQLLHLETSTEISTDWDSFLTLTAGEQLALVADKVKQKDASWLQTIIIGLQQAAIKPGATAAYKQAVVQLEQYRKYSGASVKMLLEHCIVSLSEMRR